jgi:hypothetical protein
MVIARPQVKHFSIFILFGIYRIGISFIKSNAGYLMQTGGHNDLLGRIDIISFWTVKFSFLRAGS